MSGSYCSLWFLPEDHEPDVIQESVYQLNDTVLVKPYYDRTDAILEKYTCHWNCTTDYKFQVYLSNSTYINTMYIDNKNISCSILQMATDVNGSDMCIPKKDCNLLCFEDSLNESILNRSRREVGNSNVNSLEVIEKDKVKEIVIPETVDSGSFYTSATFWAFVVLMCVGTVAFNVANCIGDAVCFDVLGEFIQNLRLCMYLT